MIQNPDCCGGHCQRETGEVRVLPISRDPHHGNVILCRACFEREIAWRKERNRELPADALLAFALPKWEDLKVYDPGS